MKSFEATITPNGRTVSYRVQTMARNLDEAKKLFRLQYPGCYVSGVREV
jgi:hypothetical protein